MKVAIVVGLDKLGKTELISMMAKHEGVQTRKVIEDPRTMDQREKFRRADREILSWSDIDERDGTQLLIYDRFPYPDEWIYGPLDPNWTSLGDVERLIWDRALANHRYRVRLVYVEPPDFADYQTRDLDAIYNTKKLETFDRIVTAYNTVLGRTRLRVIRLQPKWFTEEDATDLVKRLLCD